MSAAEQRFRISARERMFPVETWEVCIGMRPLPNAASYTTIICGNGFPSKEIALRWADAWLDELSEHLKRGGR